MNITLLFGSILGFISVAFGAYAEHGLKKQLTPDQFESLMTAVRYNQTHAVVIVSLGLLLLTNLLPKLAKKIKLTSYAFIIGTILFSFSIYVANVSGMRELINLAPTGGTTLMVAWLMLIWCALDNKNQ